MILDVYHWTEYRYSEAVPLSQHLLHLLPREFNRQRVLSSRHEITPKPVLQSERADYFGNRTSEFSIVESHSDLHIKCFSRVETLPTQAPVPAQTMPWEKVAAQLLGNAGDEARPFIYHSSYAPFLEKLREWAMASFPAGRPVLEGALDLTARIQDEFVFDNTATSVSTPLEEVFANKRGVCQDFAHLQISCLRSLGLAARYVSGYLRTEPPEGQPRLFGADASHAWVSLYCPRHGWIDMDPTNNRLVTEDYATLGWGRDYGDVSLIRGILGGGGSHSLYLSVNVEYAEPDAPLP